MTKVIPLPKPVADIYRAVRKLEAEYGERRFTPDGHLLGSLGEVVAKKYFGDGFELNKSMSHKGHDARCKKRGDVQIKITARDGIDLKPCSHLVVFRLDPNELIAELIYDGPGQTVWDGSKANGNSVKEKRISLFRLRKLQAALPDARQ